MSFTPHRVLVTGLGVVSCAGRSTESFWQHFLDDGLPIAEWPLPAEAMRNRRYYAVEGGASPVPAGKPRHGRAYAFASEAAQAALRDAGWSSPAGLTLGVCTGTGMGTYDNIDKLAPGCSELTAESASFFDISGRLAAELRTLGPSINVSTACAAGAYSMALAYEAIRHGESDAMLAGGAEGFSVIPQGCFNRLGALDDDSCRPFAADRQGTLFGEGAAYLLLESQQSFEARGGARAIAEIAGYGVSCDAHHVTAPDSGGEQIANAAREALRRADWQRPVSAVVAHGTGTQLNDEIESRVMVQTLGRGGELPWMVPIKGRIGHGGGSAGAFSSLLACLLLQRQRIPPCGIRGEVDAACAAARFNRAAVRDEWVESVLVNAYAFGGNNISVLFTTPAGRPA